MQFFTFIKVNESKLFLLLINRCFSTIRITPETLNRWSSKLGENVHKYISHILSIAIEHRNLWEMRFSWSRNLHSENSAYTPHSTVEKQKLGKFLERTANTLRERFFFGLFVRMHVLYPTSSKQMHDSTDSQQHTTRSQFYWTDWARVWKFSYFSLVLCVESCVLS